MVPLKNFSILLFEHLFKLALGAFVSIYVARSLGPLEYGKLSYVLSFSMIFLPFFSLGSDDWLIANIAKEKDTHKLNQYLGTSLFARFIGSISGITLCFISIQLFNTSSELSFFIILYSFFMSFKSLDCINLYFVAKENVKQISLLRNVSYIISSVLKIAAIIIDPTARLIIYIGCIEFFIFSSVYLYVYITKNGTMVSWVVSKPILDKLIKLALPLTTLSFINIAIIRIDQIMLGNMVSKVQLGEYSIVAKLVELFQFLPMILLTVLLPKIFKSKSVLYDRYKNSVLLLILLISFSFAIICTLTGDFFVPLVVGEQYKLSGSILKIYIWQSLFFFLFLAKQKFFIAENDLKRPVIYGGLSLCFNVSLNYFFIQLYGVLGAVYASVLAFTLAELFMTIVDKGFRQSNIGILKSFNLIKSFNNIKMLFLEK